MVSHADIAGSAPPRGPPSISSRASTSNRRHHRHGRSHHGGSTYQPQNEFPFFAHTGDVEIIINADGQEKRYLLHRLILAQCSGFFEAGTSEEWSRVQAQKEAQVSSPGQDRALARIGEDAPAAKLPEAPVTVASLSGIAPPKTRWRYELDWATAEDEEEPMLVQRVSLEQPSALENSYNSRQSPSSGSIFGGDFAPVPPPAPRTKPPASHSSGFFRSMANLSLTPASTTHLPQVNAEPPMNETIRDYDNLFRIFYNYPPTLNSTNIAQAYTECKALLTLADMYDALPVTGPRVDHHLLRFSSRLFKQIAKYPPSYLKLGYLARSRIIFSEALIHVVGQWPLALPHLRNSSVEVPESVIELIEDKVDDLEELKARIEARLFRLTLTTNRGERVNPSNAYLDWLVVSLFRQWLAENTTPLPQPILKHNSNATGPPTRVPVNQNFTHPPAQGDHSRPPTSASSMVSPAQPPVLPNTSRVFRLLGSTSHEAYLSHDEIKRFLKLHPLNTSSSPLYSRDVLRKFERRMDEMKNLARDVVKPLMRNFLELDLRELTGAATAGGSGGGPPGGAVSAGVLGYLTCTKVDEEDLPWEL